MAQGRSLVFTARIFALLIALLAVGCGGGSPNSGNDPAPANDNPPPSEPVPDPGTDPDPAPDSAPDPVPSAVTVNEIIVTADPGLIVAVRVGEVAVLDGSGSSASTNDPLTYAWSFSSKPDGSLAELQNTTSASPSFVADVTGTYMVQLVVSAGGASSERTVTSVEVTNEGDHLTGLRVHIRYSSNCVDCHDGRYETVVEKSPDHLATSNLCQACHTTFGFDLLRYVDHLEVFGKCSECHNGVLAIGKSYHHVETTVECDDCHDTTSFVELELDGSFDHTDISRYCDACHNGIVAPGKYDSHIPTSDDCSFCHITDNFIDTIFDHSTITGNCVSCHNGSDATGQTVGHPDMAVDCGICHNTTTFKLGGVFDHGVVDPTVQPCAGCHNDDNSINARGKLSATNHPPTTEDCGVCHGVGGGSFADGIFDHTGIVDNCAECHGESGNGSGPGVTANHIPINADCSACHSPGTFATGVFDHDLSVYVPPVICNTCHNGTISVGKNTTHIPTNPDNQDCADCHLSTDTFAGTIFTHAGIDTSNCALCHNGEISTGKSVNHMETIRDCSDCHVVTKFDDFTGATFDHLGVSDNCTTCHDGVIAIGKTNDHIPTQDDCSVCHNDTTSFTSSTFLNTVHQGIVVGCEGCHNGRFATAKDTAVNHVPTDQDCHFCHTNDVFSPSIFDHSGITDNCALCHDGTHDDSGAIGLSLNHIVTTEDCGVCHNTTNFAGATFDHTGIVNDCASCHGGATPSATPKNADHIPTTEDCSVCHVPGTFANAVFDHTGIVDNCASCHDTGLATGMSANHIPITEDCSVCHNTTAFAGARFDHQGVVDNCASCHDGNLATGKPNNHVPTNDDCSSCHQITGFIPATFDHIGIVDNCQSCHDGDLAIGKPINHIVTNGDCGLCHSTSTFNPATFDHSGIVDGCADCHDGNTATGKNQNHLDTSLDCYYCHTTATFKGGTWDHTGITGNCESCHDGVTATGNTPQGLRDHFITTNDCNTCHTTNGWAPVDYNHPANSDYPGDHNGNVGCIKCHTQNNQNISYPSPTYAGTCAACHANDYDNGAHNGSLSSNANCGKSECHRVSARGW